MTQQRCKARSNVEWDTSPLKQNSLELVAVEVLMDIREELQRLNRLLHCDNFTDVPHKLERIARNTSKPRKKRAT